MKILANINFMWFSKIYIYCYLKNTNITIYDTVVFKYNSPHGWFCNHHVNFVIKLGYNYSQDYGLMNHVCYDQTESYSRKFELNLPA